MSPDPLSPKTTDELALNYASTFAATFAALGDARRLALIKRLHGADELSISALCEGMDISRQAVSKHLKTLADARLVCARKSGRETLYTLEKQKLEEARHFLNLIGDKWDGALSRLKAHLED